MIRMKSKLFIGLILCGSIQVAHGAIDNSPQHYQHTCTQGKDSTLKTIYPVVLVHGLMGWGKEPKSYSLDYWYKIPYKLCKKGASVFIVSMSAMESAEIRGEQLLQQIDDILILTGAEKVNLIAHSQGAQPSRYVAAVAPEWIASVTTAAGTHMGGMPIANLILEKVPDEGTMAGHIIYHIANSVGYLISRLMGNIGISQDLSANLYDLSTEGMAEFNRKYPAGLPAQYCGEGASEGNGVRFFSWSGNRAITNFSDPTDYLLFGLSKFGNEASDGLVPRCASRFGEVIRDTYPMNHFDQVNHFLGINARRFNTSTLVINHVRRLKSENL